MKATSRAALALLVTAAAWWGYYSYTRAPAKKNPALSLPFNELWPKTVADLIQLGAGVHAEQPDSMEISNIAQRAKEELRALENKATRESEQDFLALSSRLRKRLLLALERLTVAAREARWDDAQQGSARVGFLLEEMNARVRLGFGPAGARGMRR